MLGQKTLVNQGFQENKKKIFIFSEEYLAADIKICRYLCTTIENNKYLTRLTRLLKKKILVW